MLLGRVDRDASFFFFFGKSWLKAAESPFVNGRNAHLKKFKEIYCKRDLNKVYYFS